MTSKIMLGAIVAIAFVAGTITTGAAAYAAAGGTGDNLIADAIDRLTAVMADNTIVGPQGDQGPQGIQGPQGEPGDLSQLSKYEASAEFEATTTIQTAVVKCDDGDIAVSGGWRLVDPDTHFTNNNQNNFDPKQWDFSVSTSSGTDQVFLYATCLDITP